MHNNGIDCLIVLFLYGGFFMTWIVLGLFCSYLIFLNFKKGTS
jgi:hypothetical protein